LFFQPTFPQRDGIVLWRQAHRIPQDTSSDKTQNLDRVGETPSRHLWRRVRKPQKQIVWKAIAGF
jgi:hypothetical protein